jgi:hypothetical protein
VLRVEYDRMRVRVEFRQSEVSGVGMVENELKWIDHITNVFKTSSGDRDYIDLSAEREELLSPQLAEKELILRHITHKNYKNDWPGNIMEKMKESDVPVGEIMFFPGTEPHTLRALWKLNENIFVSFSVSEPKQDGGQLLGSVLEIDGETYDDLDEIIFRMIDPMNKHVRSLESCPKFKFLSRGDIESLLQQEKAQRPSYNPYYIGFSARHPGTLELSYLPSLHTVRRHYIRIIPGGFQLVNNKKTFKTVDALIGWFKTHATTLDAPPRHSGHREHHSSSSGHSYHQSRYYKK